MNKTTVKWIKKPLQFTVMVNGFLTPRSLVGRAPRQGDSIASYLFILCVELLLLKLKTTKPMLPTMPLNK